MVRQDWRVPEPDLRSVVALLDGENRVVAALGDGDPSGLRDHLGSVPILGKLVRPHSAKLLQRRYIR